MILALRRVLMGTMGTRVQRPITSAKSVTVHVHVAAEDPPTTVSAVRTRKPQLTEVHVFATPVTLMLTPQPLYLARPALSNAKLVMMPPKPNE